ncbi:MAG: oligosaccharide flippase family protein [Flavobacteriales bacterium]|jgi:O-antigen/teichoic acid export membrane protein|nr:oligosaccharide flippase family protein [Flavobacteriales bacterium]
MSTVKNVTTLVFGKGINIIINILFLPFLARTLSIAEYGDYGQTILVVDVIKMLFSGGLASIVFVYLSNNRNNKQVISSNYYLGITLGVIACVLLIGFSELIGLSFNNENIPFYITLYSFSVIFSIPATTLSSVLIFYKKVPLYTKTLVLINTLRLILLFIAIQFFSSLKLVFIFLSLLELIKFILLTAILKSRLSKDYLTKVKAGVEQLKTGVYLNFANILGFLTLATDSIMISLFKNEESFAIYKNGAFEVPLISVLYLSISQLFLPKITQHFSNDKLDTIANIKKKLSLNIAAIVYPFCIFFITFSSDFITLYLSEKYIDSALIFTIFNLSLLMRIYDYLDVLIASKNTKKILYLQIFAILFNLVLNAFFIYYFDIKGAAIATIITLFIYAFIALKMNANILKTKLTAIIDLPKILFTLLIASLCILPFLWITISDNIFIDFSFKFLYFPLTYFLLYQRNFIDEKIVTFFKQKLNAFLPSKT